MDDVNSLELQQIKELRLELLKDIDNDSEDDIFKQKLKQAKYIALNLLYPFDNSVTTLPKRVAEDWQVRCAIELYNKMGEEGIVSYSENGLSYTKNTGLISKELFNELLPNADVPR